MEETIQTWGLCNGRALTWTQLSEAAEAPKAYGVQFNANWPNEITLSAKPVSNSTNRQIIALLGLIGPKTNI